MLSLGESIPFLEIEAGFAKQNRRLSDDEDHKILIEKGILQKIFRVYASLQYVFRFFSPIGRATSGCSSPSNSIAIVPSNPARFNAARQWRTGTSPCPMIAPRRKVPFLLWKKPSPGFCPDGDLTWKSFAWA